MMISGIAMEGNLAKIERDVLLRETVAEIESILGNELENIVVERAVLGLFFSGVKLTGGYGGLCFTPIKEIPEAVCCPSSAKAMPLSGRLSGRPVIEYVKDVFSDNILRKTLGIAAVNALSTICWERNPPKDYEIVIGEDSFDQVDVTQYSNPVVIGALVPIMKKFTKENIDFKVLEMAPEVLKERERKFYAPDTDAHLYVPDADLLVITGVTIINDTLPELLSMIKGNPRVIVTGPTASMIPTSFFKHGVTELGGIVVTKPDEVLDIISEGGSGYHFFGKSAERTILKRKLG